MLAGGLAFLAYQVRSVLPPFGLALAIAYLLDPIIRWLVGRGLSRLAALVVIYLTLGGGTAGLLLFLIPQLLAQLTELAADLPRLIWTLETLLARLEAGYTRTPLPEAARQAIDQGLRDLERTLVQGVEVALAGLGVVVTTAFSLILAPVIAFYLLRDIDRLKVSVLDLISGRARAEVLGLLREIDGVLGAFVRSQLLIAGMTGLVSALALFALGLDFALLLGLFIGVTNVIPYLGPILGAIPAVILAMAESPGLAVKTVIALTAIQQLETAVIQPRVVGGSVGLHPVLVIFAVLAGARLAGVPGVLLAVPVAAVAKVLLLYLHRWWRAGSRG
ncbi:MAG TPA: AI-2E family transporter [Bacillota bacterium]|nr:AI-2E family transporter [Bacillota bacterium]